MRFEANALQEVWPDEFYNPSTTDDNSPIRDIMADAGIRRMYFKQMSMAYAQMCSGAAYLYTADVNNIPQDGIWGEIEFPTIMRDSDFQRPKGQVVGVTAFKSSDLSVSKPIWQRTQPASASAVTSSTDNNKLMVRGPPNGLPVNFPDPQVINDVYGDLNW